MASYSRIELINKFQKELEDWNTMSGLRAEAAQDTTHIQMASVDEVMSAYGYAPRRLPNFPEVRDGRFGYYLVDRSCKNKCALFSCRYRMRLSSIMGMVIRVIHSAASVIV
ncbi:hypothetical protein SP40_69 [Salmonella phage 40]|nr:hypothetical protein SP40_69 [Salmonella phage 40]